MIGSTTENKNTPPQFIPFIQTPVHKHTSSHDVSLLLAIIAMTFILASEACPPVSITWSQRKREIDEPE